MTWTQAVRVSAGHERVRREAAVTVWGRLAVVVVGLVVWWLVVVAEVLSPNLLPNPVDVAVAFAELVASAPFWAAIGATLLGALLGLLGGAVVGLPIGVVTGRSEKAELSLRFLLDFGRAFPAVALVGVFVLLFGRGTEMTAVLVWVAVVFPIALQTQHGVRRVEPMIVETSRAFRIPTGLLLRKVLLPSAAPYIMTGFRLAATVAVLVAISAEVLTGAPGIGSMIVDAQLGSNAPRAFALILFAGLLGYLVNLGVDALQRRTVSWRPAGEED